MKSAAHLCGELAQGVGAGLGEHLRVSPGNGASDAARPRTSVAMNTVPGGCPPGPGPPAPLIAMTASASMRSVREVAIVVTHSAEMTGQSGATSRTRCLVRVR